MASFISIRALIKKVGMLLSILMTIIGKTVSVRSHNEATGVVGCCEWKLLTPTAVNNGCDPNHYEDDCRKHIADRADVSFWKGSGLICTESRSTGRNVCATRPDDGFNWRATTLGWSCPDLLQTDRAKKRGEWSRMPTEKAALSEMSVYADYRCWGGIYNVLDKFKGLVDAKIPLTSLKSNDMMDLSALEVAAAWAEKDMMAKLVEDYGASTEIPLNSEGIPKAIEFGKRRFYTPNSYDEVLQFLGLGSKEEIQAVLEIREAKRQKEEEEEAEARRQAEEEVAEARRQAELKRKQEEQARREKENQECNECCENRRPYDYDPYECEDECRGNYGC